MKPAILVPAEAPSVHLAARTYAAMGFSVLPCAGKKPAISEWKHLQHRIALAPTIDLWHKVGLLQNVGVICGAVSNNLVVIDLDGDAAVEAFSDRWSKYMTTYAVASGSGHGQHLYYYVRDLPPTTRVTGLEVGNIELRSNGAYVVAPPSIHPDSGKPYAVANALDDILFVPNLSAVVRWIKALIAEKHGGIMPPPANEKRIFHKTAYGMVALRNEAASLASASDGGRNSQLYRSALKMGSLVADDKIDPASVRHALFDAAIACGLVKSDGGNEVMRQINNGIHNGMESSRDKFNNA